MPYAHFTYTVIGQRVVAPTDVAAAVADVGYSRLVLSACTPLFSAAKRLLVYARLTRTVPVGAARVLPGERRRRADRSARGDERGARGQAAARPRYQRARIPRAAPRRPARLSSVTPGAPVDAPRRSS